MTELQDWITEIESDAADGASADDSVTKLRANGISVVSSIRIIRNSYKIPLAEAKSLVANHNVWNSMTESVKPFHDELITDINRVVFSDTAYKGGNDFGDRYESLLMRRSELEKQLETVRSELGRINSEIISIERGTADFQGA